MDSLLWKVLSSHSLFSCFSEETLRFLFSKQRYLIKEYGKDQMIYLQGESCTTLDILLEGRVSIQNLETEKKVFTVQILNAGDVYGATLLFSSFHYYPLSVVSLMNCRVLHLSKDLVLGLCKEDNAFIASLLRIISDKAYALTTTITNISCKTLRENLLAYLRYEAIRQQSKVITLEISKTELAERLGVQRTSISRELSKMREDGLVQVEARTITLLA